MKVKLLVQMSGTRNGEAWPALGEEATLPETEAVKLCAAGMAVPVPSDTDDIEQRETTPAVEPEPTAKTEGSKASGTTPKRASKRA